MIKYPIWLLCCLRVSSPAGDLPHSPLIWFWNGALALCWEGEVTLFFNECYSFVPTFNDIHRTENVKWNATYMVVAYILWHYARAMVLENYSREHRALNEDTIFQTPPLPFPILQSPWWNKIILTAGTEKENCSENSCSICLLMQQASTQNCHRERERTVSLLVFCQSPSIPGLAGIEITFLSAASMVLCFDLWLNGVDNAAVFWLWFKSTCIESSLILSPTLLPQWICWRWARGWEDTTATRDQEIFCTLWCCVQQ